MSLYKKRGPGYVPRGTYGYKAWRAVRLVVDRDIEGREVTVPAFKNVVTGDTHIDWDRGWDGAPPEPTGDCAHLRHVHKGSEELWESLRKKAIEDAQKEGRMPPLWTRFNL